MWSELENVREEDFGQRSKHIVKEAAIAWNATGRACLAFSKQGVVTSSASG
jgi:hypothetical protein